MLYEFTYLIAPEADYNKTVGNIDELLKKLKLSPSPKSVNRFPTSPKKLSYSINHHASAYYYTVRFESENGAFGELEKSLKVNKDIIRHLIIKLPKEALIVRSAKPSIKKVDKKEQKIKNDKKDKVDIEELDKKLDEILDI